MKKATDQMDNSTLEHSNSKMSSFWDLSGFKNNKTTNAKNDEEKDLNPTNYYSNRSSFVETDEDVRRLQRLI